MNENEIASKRWEESLEEIKAINHPLSHALTQMLYDMREIKDGQKGLAKSQTKLAESQKQTSIELNQLRTVITGQKELGQKGIAERLNEAEKKLEDVGKFKTAVWVIGVIATFVSPFVLWLLSKLTTNGGS